MNGLLRAMEYPCTREDLAREARKVGPDLESALAYLPARSYSGAWDVLHALALGSAAPSS